MEKTRETKEKARSTELSAGTGFTFEDAAGAYYLSALLFEGYAPGVENRIVHRIAFQQRSFKEPLDDLIVDFRDAAGEPARLSLQVKRSLTISAAASNDDFREVIQDSWLTYQKDDFRRSADRYGVAVGDVAKDKARALISLCEKARESLTASAFAARFADGGDASAEIRAVRDDIAELLALPGGHLRSESEMHEFLAHLVLVEFDFLHSGAVSHPTVMTQLRHCLAAGHENEAPLLWKTLCQTVRDSAGNAGEFDRPRLVRALSPIIRLRASPSLRGDLEKLTELVQTWAADITNDVGGIHLNRKALSEELADLLSKSRFVQIRGLPGSGKSVVLRQRLDTELQRGPVLFLKSDRLDGKGWTNFASINGLSNSPLVGLLVEIEATGSNTLFIDGIDRIEKDHQAIVLDVLRAILKSPMLASWRIVVSLRDSGMEPLRNWLGEVLGQTSVATLDVAALNDDEAEALAQAKPALRGLLFGPPGVREIVRRPFFAKILSQAFGASRDTAFRPQTEVDLIEHWWIRGGYNAEGQTALARQRALIELGSTQARHLSQSISLQELTAPAIALIDEFVSDGIIRHVRQGHTVRFAHDILFEWCFFHVLTDKGANWPLEVHSCGEPPALARVVELLSQYEYREGKAWTTTLRATAASGMRPQWTRAWLLGPIAASTFSQNDREFADASIADGFYFLRKALVWFQAERTTPNANILASGMPQEQRIRIADYLGWPSDYASWRHLIQFLLARMDAIPSTLYPEVVSVFQVWQNALAGVTNPISSAIVARCATWLREIDGRNVRATTDKKSQWDSLKEMGEFRQSLISIVLRSAISMPQVAEEYLRRVISLSDLREKQYSEIVAYSQILAGTHPKLLAELTLKHLKEELPDDKAAREEKEMEEAARWRREARAKPAAERTKRDEAILASMAPLMGQRFSYHDWSRLSIEHDTHNFWPASPLREPFRSLFKSAPEEGIKLLNGLCNHAITAWRQLHRHIRESPPPGTPLPLVIEFPWGKQGFCGGDREYIWYRGMGGPEPIECGFMALEAWCFSELERGRPVDELIRQIVEGNQCVAILGVAALLALHTSQISETVYPLVTAQRLLSADHYRMVQDLTASSAALMGFTKKNDLPHFEAVKAANARSVRQQQLSWLVPNYVLGGEFGERTRAAILAFKDNLPYQLEEHKNDPAAREHYTKEALAYVELADTSNYRARKLPDREGLIEVTHVSPSASLPENVEKVERATISLQQGNLWARAAKALEDGKIDDPGKMAAELELARKLDSDDLYTGDADNEKEMRRGAVASMAALILEFRKDRSVDELNWAREVLWRAKDAPDTRGVFWCSQSVIPWHPGIFIGRGLAADLRHGTANHGTSLVLLSLVTHPLELVSMTALGQMGKMWDVDAKLVWAALHLAFTLCLIEPQLEKKPRGPSDPIHPPAQTKKALGAAIKYYEKGSGWPELPLPPPAWVKVKGKGKQSLEYPHDIDIEDLEEPKKNWAEPDTHWYSQYAAKVLKGIPFEQILASVARDAMLRFADRILEWTNAKNAPPWLKKGRRDRESSRLFEWTHELGSTLGRLSGLLPVSEVKTRFLQQIFSLEGDTCWALLEPYVSTYTCRYVYDAQAIPEDAVQILNSCLERLLKSGSFKRGSYNAGEFYGFDQPRLLESLMFVFAQYPALGAARFANGDWSEVGLILPIVDRFVRAGGWAGTVMSHFLTLSERAKGTYPVELFADQILAIVDDGTEPLLGWHGSFIPARIAGLVEHFANRDESMPIQLAQKLLRVLDLLVDMGDRRSAALQLSERFREIKAA